MALKIGIIGYGAIGQSVHRMLEQAAGTASIGVLVRTPPAGTGNARITQSLDDFLAMEHDIVVECAGQDALKRHGHAVLEAGASLVPASVGALVDEPYRMSLIRAAGKRSRQIRIPSGAMTGIDGLAAARLAGLDSVLYRGTMPAHALRNFESSTPILQKTLVFQGSANEAVSRFPKNANLTGTIALAGIGFEATRVELYIDPDTKANIHELMASGAFGEFHVRVSGHRISEISPSSRIVPGSLAQATLGSAFILLG